MVVSASGVTRGLAEATVAARFADIPVGVVLEGKRSLLNVIGVAVAGARTEGCDIIMRTAQQLGGPARAPVPGRADRADSHFAALATGFAAHVDDYDDTHLATVIHPSAASFAAALALEGLTRPTGSEFFTAFALGCEIQLRVGVAISPAHYDEGWHITGTCGVLGAAVAAAKLLRLDAAQTMTALSLAASSSLGHREGFGRMTKAFHPGKAAANGILAALLAREGFDGRPDALEGRGGFADAMSLEHRIGTLSFDLWRDAELLKNTYKPYPCGIVAHPHIDAAIALRARTQVGAIERVSVRCHPLVPELMGRREPLDELEARFSAIHGMTAGLLDGVAGLREFETEYVNRDDVRALRARIVLEPSDTIRRDESRTTVTLRDGTQLEEHVQHARGSADRPLTTEELFEKTRALVEPMLPGRTARIRDAVDGLDAAPNLEELIAAITAGETARA